MNKDKHAHDSHEIYHDKIVFLLVFFVNFVGKKKKLRKLIQQFIYPQRTPYPKKAYIQEEPENCQDSFRWPPAESCQPI